MELIACFLTRLLTDVKLNSYQHVTCTKGRDDTLFVAAR